MKTQLLLIFIATMLTVSSAQSAVFTALYHPFGSQKNISLGTIPGIVWNTD